LSLGFTGILIATVLIRTWLDYSSALNKKTGKYNIWLDVAYVCFFLVAAILLLWFKDPESSPWQSILLIVIAILWGMHTYSKASDFKAKETLKAELEQTKRNHEDNSDTIP
jgi:hypothetical protein